MLRRVNRFIPSLNFGGPGRAGAAVRRMRLTYENLPEGLDGKRLLYAADIHMGPAMPRRAVAKLIAQIEALRPDAVLWGGDYAETRAHTERFFEMIADLRPPLGMYGAIGNNDYENFRFRADEVKRLAARFGVSLLINRAWTIEVAGGRLVIAGSDELEYGSPSGRMLLGQVKKSDFRVLLCHSPQSIDPALKNVPHKPQLALCGHTHGGQIRLGSITPYSFLYDHKQIKNSRYFGVSGFYHVDGTDVLVTNGVGTSLLPLRFGAPPEIHLIELSSGRLNKKSAPLFGGNWT